MAFDFAANATESMPHHQSSGNDILYVNALLILMGKGVKKNKTNRMFYFAMK